MPTPLQSHWCWSYGSIASLWVDRSWLIEGLPLSSMMSSMSGTTGTAAAAPASRYGPWQLTCLGIHREGSFSICTMGISGLTATRMTHKKLFQANTSGLRKEALQPSSATSLIIGHPPKPVIVPRSCSAFKVQLSSKHSSSSWSEASWEHNDSSSIPLEMWRPSVEQT